MNIDYWLLTTSFHNNISRVVSPSNRQAFGGNICKQRCWILTTRLLPPHCFARTWFPAWITMTSRWMWAWVTLWAQRFLCYKWVKETHLCEILIPCASTYFGPTSFCKLKVFGAETNWKKAHIFLAGLSDGVTPVSHSSKICIARTFTCPVPYEATNIKPPTKDKLGHVPSTIFQWEISTNKNIGKPW